MSEVKSNLTKQLEEFNKGEPIVDRLNDLPLGGIVSYSELCNLLGETEVAGDSRKAQRTRWGKYMVLETVGRKLMIKQVFSPKGYQSEGNFHVDETHIFNSSLLLQDYLIRMLPAADDTTIEGIFSLTLFNKDIAQRCGYIPEKFYDYRQELKAGQIYGEARPLLQMYLASCVSTTFANLARKLLTSLERKKLIVIRNVYVGVSNGSKWDLSEEEVVQYNSVLLEYAKLYNKGKILGINTSNKVFKSMLIGEGLPYLNVYKGYKVFFKESVIRDSLERELKQQLVNSNNGHFKGKVKVKSSKDWVKANREAWEAKESFNVKALFGLDTPKEIDWLLEEFLTYGEISLEEDD